MKFKIISDSTCDLPQALIEQYDIAIVPLTIIKNDQAFRDGITITPDNIFDHVAAGGALCSTSAVSVGEYIDCFESFTADYDAVIHISLGSGFSSCYQNACLAAQEFDNVHVLDSQNLCNGQGLVVLEVCKLAKTAETVEALMGAMEHFIPRVEISFLVDKLDYLVKGGRCSAAAALGANLLNLKPCIEVRDNKMLVVKKYRGSFEKSLTAYAKERLTGRNDLDGGMLILPQTSHTMEIARLVKGIAQDSGNFSEVCDTFAGCTISCHCGPDALGLAHVRK